MDVGTLDAFFIRAALAFGDTLDLPTGWRISDLPGEQRMRSEALQEILAGRETGQLVELLRVAARGTSRRSVHDRLLFLMGSLLDIAEELDPRVEDPWATFQPAPPGAIVDDHRALGSELESMPLPLTRKGTPNKSWEKAVAQLAADCRDANWESLARHTLCQRVLDEELKYGPAAIDGEALALIRRTVALTEAQLRNRLAAEVRALGALTDAFRDAYRGVQHRRGQYSFTDVTRKIGSGDPLVSHPDLFFRMDARTSHILLDEFQDTSLSQWEALQPLVDEVLMDDSRASVVVADPKQSIYGWRGAEPGIVRNYGKHYQLEPEHLAHSWRSSSVVLQFVNQIFTDLSDNPILAGDEVCQRTAAEWSQDFLPHQAAKDLPGYVSIEAGPGDEGGSRKRPNLYRYAAKRIVELAALRPGLTIGVLARTNDVVARLFLELRKRGLEVSQEGGNPVTDTGVCEAILSMIRLADHPSDTIARYHVANSPLGAILGLRNHREAMTAEIVARRLRRRLMDDGYGETLSAIADQVVAKCSPRDARRLFQLTELAHRFDASATLRPADFIRAVESERMEDPITADVRVMTIHQAKGLEFDIVVLPQLDESILQRGRFVAALPYREVPEGRITAVYPFVGKEMRALFPEISRAEDQRNRSALRDGISTLYVALTRARFGLYAIVASDGPKGKGNSATPARIIRAAVGVDESAEFEQGDLLYESGDRDWYAQPGARPENEDRAAIEAPPQISVDFRSGSRRRLLPRQTPSDLRGRKIDLRDVLRVDTSDALDRGSIVHSLFELIEWSDDPLPDDRDLLERVREISPEISSETFATLRGEFHEWISDSTVGGALSRARYEVGASERFVVERELPFLHRYGEYILEGYIDRLVVGYEGETAVRAEVLDFKTDRIDSDPSSLRAFSDRYRPQISAYADAAAALYNIPRERCTGSLILLSQNRVIPVHV